MYVRLRVCVCVRERERVYLCLGLPDCVCVLPTVFFVVVPSLHALSDHNWLRNILRLSGGDGVQGQGFLCRQRECWRAQALPPSASSSGLEPALSPFSVRPEA